MSLLNWEAFAKDPRGTTIPNDGVTEVGLPKTPEEWEVLHYELSTFVCQGEYEKGLERILSTYLAHLDKPVQPAVWVSGFYGSGKSHLVRVLEYLWRDVTFPDGASARSLTDVPEEITALLKELTTAGRRNGGLWAAAGTVGKGAGDSIRLAILGIMFKSAGLPETYVQGRFVLWLRQQGVLEEVRAHVEAAGESFEGELNDLYVSQVLADAVMKAIPGFADSNSEARGFIKAQFQNVADIENEAMLELMTDVMVLQSGDRNRLPLTLLVLDELQQYIGDDSERTHKLQLAVQACSRRFGSKLLVVATGQSALQAHPQLQKLKDRFTVQIELSDTDVEKVLRQVVLRKAPAKEAEVRAVLTDTSGEIDRQLQGTKIAPRPADQPILVADYPLLPARRRFWERALRAIDRAGAAGQLRTQLRTVHESTKLVAEKPLGTVVPADFIYYQQNASMLQSAALPREIDETIRGLDDRTQDGRLRSRLSALIFLIQQLPTDPIGDIGIRPTAAMLADLLVSDLKEDGSRLRQRVPELLESLVEAGVLLKISGGAGDEYRLQTSASREWEQAYRGALAAAVADAGRIAGERSKILRLAVAEVLKNVPMTQGKTRTPRKVELAFTADKPKVENATPVWVRDEWSVTERSVLSDAQAAGTEDAVVYVFLPRRSTDDLKNAIAGHLAASEVLASKGAHAPTTAEGIEAKQGMENRQEKHQRDIEAHIAEIISSARVFQGGGTEVVASSLKEAVQEAAAKAVSRLYKDFDLADDTGWKTVMNRARQGSGDPLSAVGHVSEAKDHPACARVLVFIGGSGKRGSEVRNEFERPPYGWPREAVDGALLTLLGADLVSAKYSGSPVTPKELDGSKIGITDFRSQSVTINAAQRIQLRKVFTSAGLDVKSGEELQAAPLFLDHMLALANEAGAAAPAPPAPDTSHLEDINHLSGNEQLMAIYNERERLMQEIQGWKEAKAKIEARLPRWATLKRLLEHAENLETSEAVREQAKAIEEGRLLLSEPDPVPPLCQELSSALRERLKHAYKDLIKTYAHELKRLTDTDTWAALPTSEAEAILQRNHLKEPNEPAHGTEADLVKALEKSSLLDIENRTAAIPGRVARALEEAMKVLEPRAVPLQFPKTTLRSPAEVDAYLSKIKAEIMRHIEEGRPVML